MTKTYTPTEWANEVPRGTPLYRIRGTDGQVIADNVTIEMITAVVAGTPLTADNLNHIETGVEDAQTSANTAQTAATAAQTSANTAQTAAAAAQTSANTAQAAANVAQTVAYNAQNAATSANSQANYAVSLANTAQSGLLTHNHTTGATIPTGGITDRAVTGPKLALTAVLAEHLATGAVTATKLASASLTETHVGSHIPTLLLRRGSNGSDTWYAGDTSYDALKTRMEIGAYLLTIPANTLSGQATVWFTDTYTAPPLVFLTCRDNLGCKASLGVYSVDAQKFILYWHMDGALSSPAQVIINWLVIGPPA